MSKEVLDEKIALAYDSQVALERKRIPSRRSCRSRSGKCRCEYVALHIIAWCCFWIIFSGVIQGVVHGSLALNRISRDQFSLLAGGTRVVTMNEKLCSGIRLDDVEVFSATLVSLSQPPTLDGYSNITVNSPDTTVSSSRPVYWDMDLYRGSSITVELCMRSEGSLAVNIAFIRTKENFDSWLSSHSAEYVYQVENVSRVCPQRKTIELITSTDVDDHWYVVVFSNDDEPVEVSVTIDFHRKVYTIDEVNVIDRCLAEPKSSCEIPLTAGASYLVVGSDNVITYNVRADIDVHCIPEGWLLSVVIIPPLLFLLCFALIVFTCCYFYGRQRRAGHCAEKQSTPAIGQHGVNVPMYSQTTQSTAFPDLRPSVLSPDPLPYKSALYN